MRSQWARDRLQERMLAETPDWQDPLSRRSLLNATSVGVGGLVLASMSARGVLAQDATKEVEPEADPEADPEAEESTLEPIEGTPAGSAGTLTVYSGRSETFLGPLVPRIEALTGVDLEMRYGGTAELAAQILEEGDNSPAGLYIAQDAGALGELADDGRLMELPQDILDLVDPRFRSDNGQWVGLSGRARVAVYNTDALSEDDLPESVLDFTDSKWSGTLGWAPENGSFQSFVTALRIIEGEDAAREWLEGILANGPEVFESNGAITRAVAAGEIEVGLVNHYYLYEVEAEEGEQPIANYFFPGGDPGSLINVAGGGILTGSDQEEQALAVLRAFLSEDAQKYFASQTFEYPLIEGVEPAEGLKPLAEIESPEIDLSDLSDLQGTLELLAEVGAL